MTSVYNNDKKDVLSKYKEEIETYKLREKVEQIFMDIMAEYSAKDVPIKFDYDIGIEYFAGNSDGKRKTNISGTVTSRYWFLQP